MDTLQVTFVSRYITADSLDSRCWLLAGVWKCGETFRECWDSEHGTLQPGHSKLGHLNILHEDKHCLKIQVLLIQMEVCGKHCTVE